MSSKPSIKNRTMSFLRQKTFAFISKNPRIINIANKISGEASLNGEEVFMRFHPNDLFKSVRERSAFVIPTLDPAFEKMKKYVLTDVQVPAHFQESLGPVIRSLDGMSEEEIKNSLFYIYFTCDSDALHALRKITHAGGQYIPHLNFNITDLRTSYRFVNRLAFNALKKTWAKAERVSHLYPIVHENVCEALEITKDVPGDYVEIGVYLGGSALTALNYLSELKNAGNTQPRKAWLLDTYDGFNYTEAKESADVIWADTHKLYGVEGTIQHITNTFEGIDIPFEMVPGNICTNELPSAIGKIAVANVDVDLYEPTIAALKKVAPLMAQGGIIISEDPAATPALYGAYLAMNEFLESEEGKHFIPIFKKGQYFLIRK